MVVIFLIGVKIVLSSIYGSTEEQRLRYRPGGQKAGTMSLAEFMDCNFSTRTLYIVDDGGDLDTITLDYSVPAELPFNPAVYKLSKLKERENVITGFHATGEMLLVWVTMVEGR